jgi:prepilin-type N-terminal cleavage/methylation domain-containing protein/prepilin-type processing-associated H-X9-DG protein
MSEVHIHRGSVLPDIRKRIVPWKSIACRGFTLVELLVVIGIVALLASILLPVVNRSIDRGKRVSCQNNLRRLGEQLLFVAIEGPPGAEPGFLVPDVAGVDTDGDGTIDYSYYWFGAVANSLDPDQDIDVSSLDESKPKLFLCPKAGIDFEGNGISGWRDSVGWSDDDLSYGYRALLGGSLSPGSLVQFESLNRLSTIQNPSSEGMLADSDANLISDSRIFFKTSDTMTPPSPSVLLPGRRHNDGGNVVFVDGRVQWLSIEDLMASDGPLYLAPN